MRFFFYLFFSLFYFDMYSTQMLEGVVHTIMFQICNIYMHGVLHQLMPDVNKSNFLCFFTLASRFVQYSKKLSQIRIKIYRHDFLAVTTLYFTGRYIIINIHWLTWSFVEVFCFCVTTRSGNFSIFEIFLISWSAFCRVIFSAAFSFDIHLLCAKILFLFRICT